MIKITIPIEPVEQARPRVTRIGASIRVYDPPKVGRYKRAIAKQARLLYDGEPLDGPLKVHLKFYRHIQKSVSKKEHALRASGAHRPTVKPDVDNYVKSTLDGLTGVLWVDDNLIVSETSDKFYSDHPRVEVEVKKLE